MERLKGGKVTGNKGAGPYPPKYSTPFKPKDLGWGCRENSKGRLFRDLSSGYKVSYLPPGKGNRQLEIFVLLWGKYFSSVNVGWKARSEE